MYKRNQGKGLHVTFPICPKWSIDYEIITWQASKWHLYVSLYISLPLHSTKILNMLYSPILSAHDFYQTLPSTIDSFHYYSTGLFLSEK